MLESISFWVLYGLFSYVVYVGVFTLAAGCVFAWVHKVTDGDYCGMYDWGTAYRKWMPVDFKRSSNGTAVGFLSLFSIALLIPVVAVAISQDNSFSSVHDFLVFIADGFTGVGYVIAPVIFAFISTSVLSKAYKKAKAIKVKIDKL